ncbi:uncharacterized protein PF3D7_1120600-like isoform X1 [Diorhabda sublineata]|uniref:uncharacterized protein PF3D7_1120600-like isoform X1 n=1 Tax=Diorhabda sublineata TaxID=1163346 RepID=UPI0024E17774|nr:uncharacterized protein PF3D7_1120600-like isoform X1 [Diorhabda sublineata]
MWVIVAAIWMSTLISRHVSGENAEETNQHQYRSSKFSVGFHLFLPVAGLILVVLGRRQIFEKLLLQLDKKYLTVICPNFIRKEALLKWACNRLPPTWSSYSTKTLSGGIKDLWTDGSLLCTLINTGVPGACPNPHRHWKQPPSHAQALAYKYFGVAPIFSNDELNKKLTSTLDRKFLKYLTDIQKSINRTTSTDRESKISERYIVRGMGLFSGEQYKTAEFYIYLDENIDDDNESNVIIQIKGPFGSFGEAVAPKLINKKRKRRPIKNERRPSLNLIENLQSLQSNIINFTRSPRKICGEEIDVEAILENDRIKVTYFPKHQGMYEISLVGGGEVLKCSPFNVHIFAKDNNLDGIDLRRKRTKTVRKITGNQQNGIIYEEKVTSTDSRIKIKKFVNQIAKNTISDCTIDKNNKKTEQSIKLISTNESNIDILKKNHQKSSEKILKNYVDAKNASENINYKEKKPSKSAIVEKINLFETKHEESPCKTGDIPVQGNTVSNKQISNGGGDNSKSNNAVSEQISNGKQLISEYKQVDRNNKKNKFENELKIPDGSLENFSNKLEVKYFKSIVNETNKLQNKDDVNNNSIRDRVQIYLEKSRAGSGISKKNTSPICPDHIVPEVDYKKKNVAEKRKIFAQSSLEIGPISNNSSFSENENSLGSSVKNIQPNFNISTDIKEPLNRWSLYSTISLPNLSLDSENSSIGSVKDRKDFWENISAKSEKSVMSTKSELERSKLIWKKPTIKENNENIFKSADNILSITGSLVRTNTKKYQSVDDSLDNCTTLSIKERKKLLLKQAEEIVKITVINNVDGIKNSTERKNEKFNVKFTPIHDKIKRYNSALQLSTGEPVNVQQRFVKKIHTAPSISTKNDNIDVPINPVHHQFNKAIKYFKNLEIQSQNNKNGSKNLHDSINKNPRVRYRSGSLNIPNVSERYSINNLYDDIFGTKGSFKGTPNRSAVVKALATFSKTPKRNLGDNEDDIQYDLFKFVKKRKRKSLNSIFDIYY